MTRDMSLELFKRESTRTVCPSLEAEVSDLISVCVAIVAYDQLCLMFFPWQEEGTNGERFRNETVPGRGSKRARLQDFTLRTRAVHSVKEVECLRYYSKNLVES
jgi:hypothetical protein